MPVCRLNLHACENGVHVMQEQGRQINQSITHFQHFAGCVQGSVGVCQIACSVQHAVSTPGWLDGCNQGNSVRAPLQAIRTIVSKASSAVLQKGCIQAACYHQLLEDTTIVLCDGKYALARTLDSSGHVSLKGPRSQARGPAPRSKA